MKSLLLLVAIVSADALVFAQPVPPPGRPARPAARAAARFDRAVVRGRLGAPPRVVPRVARPGPPAVAVVPAPAPATVPVPVPATEKVTTTTTTTTSKGSRVYDTERSVVVVEAGAENRELPYVTVPVLFVKETAELLDAESAAAVEETANAIKEIAQTEPAARFDIEGHTSTDGTDEFNMALSASRARRIFDELTQRGIPREMLSAHGYGENYASHPNASEDEMQLDRRVLVVRTQ